MGIGVKLSLSAPAFVRKREGEKKKEGEREREQTKNFNLYVLIIELVYCEPNQLTNKQTDKQLLSSLSLISERKRDTVLTLQFSGRLK